MIAFLNDHPLIRLQDGSLVPFEFSWLSDCLREAASQADPNSLSASCHIASSVSAFLKEDFHGTAIDLPKLEEMVAACLRNTGFENMASRFSLPPPPSRMNLADIARAAGSGYELQFFGILSSRIQEAVTKGCHQITCMELPGCVKILRSARRWRTDCRSLQSEIVSFIRDRANAAGVNNLKIQLC